MEIVYCIDSLVPSGGTERVLTTKLNWWAKQPDVNVTVVSIRENGEPFFTIDPGVERIILDVMPGDTAKYFCVCIRNRRKCTESGILMLAKFLEITFLIVRTNGVKKFFKVPGTTEIRQK